MKKQPKPTIKTPDLSSLSAAELRLMVAQFQAVVEEQNASLLEHKSELKAAHRRIELLEEMNRLRDDMRAIHRNHTIARDLADHIGITARFALPRRS